MIKNQIIRYNSKLKILARNLRNNSTKSEIKLWIHIKNRSLGYQFHRQVPIDEYIVDFYCHELKLAIEIDGNTHDYNYVNDSKRQQKLESFGIVFIRVTDEDVLRHLDNVLRLISVTIMDLEVIEKHPPAPLQRGT